MIDIPLILVSFLLAVIALFLLVIMITSDYGPFIFVGLVLWFVIYGVLLQIT